MWPPLYTLEETKMKMLSRFSCMNFNWVHKMRFVVQPQAALVYCIEEQRKKMNPGGLITVCHMEEEVTVGIFFRDASKQASKVRL